MRITRLLLLPAVGLVACVLFGMTLFTSQAGATHLPGPPVLYQTLAPMRPAHGLVPSPAFAAQKDPSVVAFSTQDVRVYILAHGFMGGSCRSRTHTKNSQYRFNDPSTGRNPRSGIRAYTATKMVFVVNMEGPFY